MNSLRVALREAGRLGHVSPIRGGGTNSYQVRKGLGKWLMHVVKWHSSKTYRETIVQQRREVLARLSIQGSFAVRQIEQLRNHLRHGSTFQKQSMDFLETLASSVEREAPSVPGPNHEITKKLAVGKFATNDAALVNLRIPGHAEDVREGVNRKKFGAAYWQYARTKIGNPLEFSLSNDAEAAGGRGLLEYALIKDENESHKDTGLYQVATVQKENDEGIDFKAWGIPDGVDEIELRFVSGFVPSGRAQEVVDAGAQGNEALANFRKVPDAVLASTSKPVPARPTQGAVSTVARGDEAVRVPIGRHRMNTGERKDLRGIYMKSYGMDLQLADLYEQFMQEEGGAALLK